jgi:hypothetical protein
MTGISIDLKCKYCNESNITERTISNLQLMMIMFGLNMYCDVENLSKLTGFLESGAA